jgi:hypothetical protein
MAVDGSDLTLRLDSVDNMLQIVDNSGLSGPQVVEERGLDLVTSVRFSGTGLDDRLVLDFATPFTLAAGISFAADLGADELEIRNGLFDQAAYRAKGLGVGVVEQLLGLAGQTIAHSDVEALDDLSAAGDREVSNESGASRTIRLSDDGVSGSTMVVARHCASQARRGRSTSMPVISATPSFLPVPTWRQGHRYRLPAGSALTRWSAMTPATFGA